MADLVIVLTVVAFFVVCVAYVAWCDRMIGPDPAPPADGATGRAEAEAVPA